MSDLTNQINELFDGPSEPQQEPIVEQVVEPVKEEVRPRTYRKLEKPKIRRENRETPVVRTQRQTNFNINESIDSLFEDASRS